jgi:hypothetical protein
MPRYFFNVYFDYANIDSIGEELPDSKAAWREATMVTGELLRDLDGRFQPGRQWRLEVTDEARELIYVIWLTGQQVK